jgi:hypothetical protein
VPATFRSDGEEPVPLPPWLSSPAQAGVAPPVRTAPSVLPLGQLAWEDFERLCVRLAALEGDPEFCHLYGTRGQAQQGIDLYARTTDGKYTTYQAKRYEVLERSDISAAVKTFLDGSWKSRSIRFVFCTTASATRTELLEEVEAQSKVLRANGIAFDVWDEERLSARLKSQPQLVLDFFGRAWVSEFCGVGLSTDDDGRLDASEMAALRQRLLAFYSRLFDRYDALGESRLAGAPLVALDVIRSRSLPEMRSVTRSPVVEQPERDGPRTAVPADIHDTLMQERVSAFAWLENRARCLLVGSAGSGKSTLLRQYCLALLEDEPSMHAANAAFLPVWLPFGRWVARIADTHPDLSLSGALKSFFDSFDEPDLWRLVREGLRDQRLLLLVDGVDEWTDAGPAAVAGERLQQFLSQRATPCVASSRQEGLRALGPLDPEWERGEVAPLTGEQQRQLLVSLGATETKAGQFVARMNSQQTWRRLSLNPLLLGLMWSLQEAGIEVPAQRHAVLSRALRWMVVDYPRAKRVTADPTQDLTLEPEEILAALATLALEIQQASAAALPRTQALATLRTALANPQGAALDQSGARAQAAAVLEAAVGPMGLFAQEDDGRVVFVHRSLQEHLAAEGVAALSAGEGNALVHAQATNPGWHDVIVELVALLPPSDADGIAAQLLARAHQEGLTSVTLAPLLVALSMTPAQIKEHTREQLLEYAMATVEADFPPTIRAAALEQLSSGALALTGAARESVTTRLASWVPAQNEYGRAHMIRLSAEWPEESATELMWLRALEDESTRVAFAAIAAIAERLAQATAVRDRLLDRSRSALSPHVRANLLDCLGSVWPEHEGVIDLVERAKASAHPDVRLTAFACLARAGRLTDADLEPVLELLDGWTTLDYERQGYGLEILRQGWHGDDRVFALVLDTVRDTRGRPLDIQLATALLFAGYHDRAEVREHLRNQLQRDHPFPLAREYSWTEIARNFTDDETLLAALNERLVLAPARGASQSIELSQLAPAAAVLRTDHAKQYLLGWLPRLNGWPNAMFPVRALLEGWPEDEEVKQALRDFATSDNPARWHVSSVVHEFMDREAASEWLLELINKHDDATAVRVAADALGHLRPSAQADRGLEAIMERRGRRDSQRQTVGEAVLTGWPDAQEALTVGLELLTEPEVPLPSLALAAQQHPSLREAVRALATPLPVALRRRHYQRRFELGLGIAADEHQSEVDTVAAAAAASARAIARDDREQMVETFTADVQTRGYLYEARSQAGFCGLMELDALDRFVGLTWGEDRILSVDAFAPMGTNWWIASRLAEQYEEAAAAVPDLPKRLHLIGDSDNQFWSALAPFATRDPLRAAVLEWVRANGLQGEPELLRFLARTRPGSDELLNVLLRQLPGFISDRSPDRTLRLDTADILAEQFFDDDDAFALVQAQIEGRLDEGGLLAMSAAWPTRAETQKMFRAARQEQLRASHDGLVRIRLAIAPAMEAVHGLQQWLDYGAFQGWLAKPPAAALLRRAASDAEFRSALVAELRPNGHPSLLCTGITVLGATGYLVGDVRDMAEGLLERAFRGSHADVLGMDVLGGRVRPLAWCLHEALNG